jgi:uncharacterized Zn-finger protein
MTEPVTCAYCGKTYKNELVAHQDMHLDYFGKKKIPVCGPCKKKFAVELIEADY